MNLLSADRLGKRFGSRWIFRGVSFELGAGDVLAVLGANGSGKSTLLKLLSGLLPASEGRVCLKGKLGYAALDLMMYPHLTGREHLEMCSALAGSEFADSAGALDAVGLVDTPTPVGKYSSGMRARLRLAVATLGQPDVLLLDEPTAALDEAGREVVRAAVQRQAERGAVVLATNDPEDLSMATLKIEVGR